MLQIKEWWRRGELNYVTARGMCKLQKTHFAHAAVSGHLSEIWHAIGTREKRRELSWYSSYLMPAQAICNLQIT